MLGELIILFLRRLLLSHLVGARHLRAKRFPQNRLLFNGKRPGGKNAIIQTGEWTAKKGAETPLTRGSNAVGRVNWE